MQEHCRTKWQGGTWTVAQRVLSVMNTVKLLVAATWLGKNTFTPVLCRILAASSSFGAETSHFGF